MDIFAILLYKTMPFISLDGLFTWTAIGPFEWSLHALGACISSVLGSLKVENVIDVTWNNAFVPLYVASGLHFYFSVVLFARLFIFYNPSRKKLLWLCVNCVTCIAILTSLTWLEVSLAHYLDTMDVEDLILVEASGGLLLALLAACLIRLLLVKLPEDRDYYDDEFDCM